MNTTLRPRWLRRLARQAAVLPILASAFSAGAASPVLLGSEETTLRARDGTQFIVTTARVRVPELRAAADDKSVELAVVRIHPVGAGPGPAQVLLAGGPGDSGVRLALDLARQGGALLKDFADGDIIGIDQRGSGASAPSLRLSVPYGLPLDRPGSPEVWLPLVLNAARQAATEMHARGIRPQAYNTLESADDVADVLEALGYRKVVLWGRSYGSHLALAVARHHPGMIERMVLVGPEGPDHTWKLPSEIDRVLQRVAQRAGTPAMPEQLRAVIHALGKKPVRVTFPDPVTGQARELWIGAFDLQWTIAQAIGDPRALATLPAAVAEMSQGNFQRIAPLAWLLRSRAGIDSVMKLLMDLASGASPPRLARIEREKESALLGDAMNFPGRYLDGALSAAALGDTARQPVSAAMPVLILAGDLDVRTPLENAQEIAATLSQSRIVVVENGAHQFDLFGNAALRTLLGRFARGEPLKADPVVLPPLHFDQPLPTQKGDR